MAEVRAKWLSFYAEHVEPLSKEIFSHVEKMIIGTLIVCRRPCVEHGAVDRTLRILAPWSHRPRRHVVWRHSPAAEFLRRSLQARKAQLAYCVPSRDDDSLFRFVRTPDSAHPRFSRGVTGDPALQIEGIADGARFIAQRIGTERPCTRAKAGRHWSPDTARCGRRLAARRRKSSGHRRRRPTAAPTILRAAAL